MSTKMKRVGLREEELPGVEVEVEPGFVDDEEDVDGTSFVSRIM